MRLWIRASASILAVFGGALFLVLPIAFYAGTVLFAPPYSRCPPNTLCTRPPFPPRSPASMIPFWISFAVISIILGILALRVRLGPESGVALGLAFALGSIAFLFLTITVQIMNSYIVTPAAFLLFPSLSTTAMTAATVLFSYELAWRKPPREVNSDNTQSTQ